MDIKSINPDVDADKVLDVTVIEPRLKHPTIFQYFDNLGAGDYFIIHNDHDPKPLYYQLLGERGNIFTFDYLNKGPEHWLIRVQKNLDDNLDKQPGQQNSVTEKEHKNGITVAGKPNAAGQAVPDTAGQSLPAGDDIILQYDKWNAGFLCDFIDHTDHPYFREQAPQLDGLGEEIRSKHQKSHPELASIKMYQDQLLATLLFHLTQEKSALFDSVKDIEQAEQIGQEPQALILKQLYTGATLKKQANDTLAKLLAAIRSHADNYKAPADACEAYSYYFKRLEGFDLRLSRYLHLENTILLVKVSKWL